MEKLTTTQFIEKANAIHELAKYDYTETIYTNARTLVNIICPQHGVFSKRPRGHLQGQGCPKCGFKTRNQKHTVAQSNFIKRALIAHGDRYNYALANYVSMEEKVIILCATHGEFKQSPHTHLKGQGCETCGRIKANEKRDSQGTWSARRWSVNQKGRVATLYCLQFSGNCELFYKVGITFDLKQRREGFKKAGYLVTEIILHQSLDAKQIHDAEAYIIREFKSLKYRPLISFGGQQECFLPVDEIRKHIAALRYNEPMASLQIAAAGKAVKIIHQGWCAATV